MDTSYLPYCTADPQVYDVPSARVAPGEDELGPAPGSLPPGWRRGRRGPWVVLRGPAPLPAAGWKVHVAVRPERAPAVVAATLAACVELGVHAKCLATVALVRSTQAKHAPVAAAGKVVTAYPPDEAALARLVPALAMLLRGEPGARPLGELAVPGAPVSLRHGGFRELWTTLPDGREAPAVMTPQGVRADPRGPRGLPSPRSGADGRGTAGDGAPELPAAVRALLAGAERAQEAEEPLAVADVRLLRRSTGGGVYRARWADGRLVVLKEARRHTGFDAGGADAVDRLRHEHRALQRLSGTGAAPEPLALLARRDGDFLVMEHVEGPTGTALLAGTHPGVLPGGGGAGAYTAWVERFLAGAGEAVAAAHARGVAHQDLHPGNLVDAGDRVVMVDLESASVDGATVARGVRSAVFVPPAGEPADGPGADLAALRRLRTVLTTPVAVVLARRPDAEDDVRRLGCADLAADGRMAPLAPATRTSAARLVAGVHAAATPGRDDRLFPGDVAQFRRPGAALGLLHGAAGVLLALRAAGVDAPASWTSWFRARAGAGGPRGLGDGVDGRALGAALAGQPDVALDLARGPLAAAGGPAAPWWGSGRAGLAVAAAELAVLLDLPVLHERAGEHARAAASAVDAAGSAAGHRPGLLAGWAGVALGLLRVAELTPDPDLARTARAAARRAVAREAADCPVVGTGRLGRDGSRLVPYLGTGVAALGCAAGALAALGGEDPAVDPAALAAQVAETMRCPVVLQAGLLHGRCGLLLVLDRLAPGDPAVDAHRARLAWHTAPYRGAPDADLLHGDQQLRGSLDLATGSAGALLALGAAGRDPLAAVLRLPRGLPSPQPVTTVTTGR